MSEDREPKPKRRKAMAMVERVPVVAALAAGDEALLTQIETLRAELETAKSVIRSLRPEAETNEERIARKAARKAV